MHAGHGTGKAVDSSDEANAIGFISALVSDEVIPTISLLRTRGWSEVKAPALNDAFITKWSRKIDGRFCYAFVTGIGRMGQTASAIETLAFLTRCNPTLLFLTGIAGSLKMSSIQRADVVVSASTRWRTQNKVTSGTNGNSCHVYRPYEHPVTPYTSEFSKSVQQFITNNFPRRNRLNEEDILSWNVHHQEVFSWDYVLSSSSIVADINHQFPSAACVEMEGGGFLAAIDKYSQLNGNRKMKGFIVKGISDYAEAKGPDNYQVRLAASTNSADVGLRLGEWLMQKKNAGLLLKF